jgi:hypothetical protein
MQPKSRRRPSPAMILALIALTFALGGTALAGPSVSKLTKSKVRTIADKEINKLAPGLSVANADKATTATTAGASSVGAGALEPITRVQATSGAVANNSIASAFVQCPAGTRVLGGGGEGSVTPMLMTLNRGSDPNGWRYDAFNASGGPGTATVYAYCLAG